MIQQALSATRDREVEKLLAEELARAERALGGVESSLRGLLGSANSTLSDRIVAQVRALIEDLARQLTTELADASGRDLDSLADALIDAAAVLRHAHALALEDELAERLAARLALDPALPPLVQRLASTDAAAFGLIGAQAGFVQAQRRGELAIAEWPLEVLQGAFASARGDDASASNTAPLEAMVPAALGERDNRLALLKRVAAIAGDDALDLRGAGLALFVTALAQRAGLDRDETMLVTADSNGVSLALALRACGRDTTDIEQQLFALHPDAGLPNGFAALSAERAAALLGGARGLAGA